MNLSGGGASSARSQLLPLPAADVELVILTHAHSGYLPKRTSIVHGEPTPAKALAKTLREAHGWPNVEVPDYLKRNRCLKVFKQQ